MNVTAAEASLNKESVSVLCNAVTSGFANFAKSIKALEMRGGLVISLRYVIVLGLSSGGKAIIGGRAIRTLNGLGRHWYIGLVFDSSMIYSIIFVCSIRPVNYPPIYALVSQILSLYFRFYNCSVTYFSSLSCVLHVALISYFCMYTLAVLQQALVQGSYDRTGWKEKGCWNICWMQKKCKYCGSACRFTALP